MKKQNNSKFDESIMRVDVERFGNINFLQDFKFMKSVKIAMDFWRNSIYIYIYIYPNMYLCFYICCIKGFRTIVFIFIVISTAFRSICPPAFFRWLSNSGTFTELRTTSIIEYTGVACSDSISQTGYMC